MRKSTAGTFKIGFSVPQEKIVPMYSKKGFKLSPLHE